MAKDQIRRSLRIWEKRIKQLENLRMFITRHPTMTARADWRDVM